MEIQNRSSESSYSLKKLALVSSSFQVPNIDFIPDDDFKLLIDIHSSEIDDKNFFEVTLALTLELSEIENPLASVEYSGRFQKKYDDDKLRVEDFSNINAPAIIFPYIRHHIRHLSLEAGFQRPIILPLINFIKLAKQNQDRD